MEFRRASAWAIALVLWFATAGWGQEWARRMFDATDHKFGTVARGAKAEYRFKITNLYEEDVHISGVRSSCGCTTAEVTKDTLKTFEESELVAVYNTRSFKGDKNATLTVTFDKPFFAEVQVHVSGHIRSDVVLNPGSVDLGSFAFGTPAQQTIAINFAGRSDWQVVDVQTVNPLISAQLVETARGRGQVSYNLTVRLAEGAPIGYVKEQLTLLTNDSRSAGIPVDVEGRVVSEVSVSPASLFMGVLQPGQKVTKQLLVRAKREFRIMGIQCEDESFSFKTSEDSKALHVVPVTFVAGDTPGKVTQTVRIETDLGMDAVPSFQVYAQVVAE